MAIPSAGVTYQSDRWHLIGSDIEFGESLSLAVQYAAGVWPRWAVEIDLMVRRHPQAEWFAFEAWRETRRGRLVHEFVTPRPVRMHSDVVPTLKTWTGGKLWTGGKHWIGPAGDFGGQSLALLTNAAQFAPTIRVNIPAPLVVGKFFWLLGDMYRVVGKGSDIITIQPRLRRAATAGEALAGSGIVRMALATADSAQITRGTGPASQVKLSMVEVRG